METAKKEPQLTYQPGVCNIGPAEIENRKQSGIAGALLALGFSFIAAVFHFPILIRLLVFIPAIIAAIGFVQVYFHFCVGFGLANVFNFGAKAGETQSVADQAARDLDRRQAWKLVGISTSLALVYTLISTFLF